MKEKNLRMTAFKALGIIVVVSCHLDENLKGLDIIIFLEYDIIRIVRI